MTQNGLRNAETVFRVGYSYFLQIFYIDIGAKGWYNEDSGSHHFI